MKKKKSFSLSQSCIYTAAEATDSSTFLLGLVRVQAGFSRQAYKRGLTHTQTRAHVCVHRFDAALLWSGTHSQSPHLPPHQSVVPQ